LVLDCSALLAILFDEPDQRALSEKIEADPRRLLSAVTLVEASILLLARLSEAGPLRLNRLLREAQVEVVPVDHAQSEAAIDAFRRFGKGRHPAGLNFGDCFAYALAAVTGEPLLFKGDDFAKTDIAAA
jgi:ribonuclease VapC